MALSDEQLQKLLGEFEVLDAQTLTQAQTKARETETPLAEYLVAHEHITDAQLGQLMADHFKVAFVDLGQEHIDPEVARLIPEPVARAQHTLAYRRTDETLFIATADPNNYAFLKSLEQKIGMRITVGYATPPSIITALSVYKNNLSDEVETLIKNIEKNPEEQNHIVQLVDTLVAYAQQSGASDIHLEPSRKQLAFRLRIDGVMHTVLQIPVKLATLILTRIKIMSKLRTDEHRVPQDGKFRFTSGGNALDVRVSIVPVTAGENIVMRLLATQGRRFFLRDLGFSEPDLEKIQEVIKSPHGMILTTGPTGSGKTTTLYTMLQLLHTPEVTIQTIEDPVEYDMEGISQIQVDTAAGLTFAAGLRSIVRQDPDIIMVGEIRDHETASIAINSAMTGHLVLSTLHANNAPTAIPRLLDMEIEPFLVGSTVNVIMAQRLVRKICERCRVSYQPDKKELTALAHDTDLKDFFASKGYRDMKKLRLYKGTGCDACNGTGYKGRVGIFEVMEMSEAIKPLVLARASSDDILAAARKEGMTTMLEDGLEKALNGITTVDEVIRVTTL